MLAEELGPGLCGRDELMSRERIARDLENFRSSLRWAIDADDAEVALRLVDALAIVGSLRPPYGLCHNGWRSCPARMGTRSPRLRSHRRPRP